MATYKGDNHCIVCGAWTPTTCRYCSDCRKSVRRAVRQKTINKKKAEENLPKMEKPKKPIAPLSEVVRLADAAGMSYAKYCLKYGI